MLIADALIAVKDELDIDVATWDTDITRYVTRAVNRLFPYVQSEVKDTTVSLTDTQWRFTLPATCESIRFMYDASDYRVEDFIQHAREVILKETLASGTLTIYGNGRYTLATLPAEYEEAIIYYAIAYFYSFLAGNKRKYNVYMQNASNAVSNMREMADWYEGRANTYLQDRGVLLGYE